MRLDAPITVLPRAAIEDGTTLSGKYLVNKHDQCVILLTKTHLDPAVYDDPNAFRPERMLTNNLNKLPKNAWRPFGGGVRAVSVPSEARRP
jgi:cytochrome P450 / NADPH-cytochrome P450 reductase